MNEAFCSEEEVHVGRLMKVIGGMSKLPTLMRLMISGDAKLKASNLKINENQREVSPSATTQLLMQIRSWQIYKCFLCLQLVPQGRRKMTLHI